MAVFRGPPVWSLKQSSSASTLPSSAGSGAVVDSSVKVVDGVITEEEVWDGWDLWVGC